MQGLKRPIAGATVQQTLAELEIDQSAAEDEHLDRFKEGLRDLLDDEPLRRRLGKEGREWVVKEHSEESFWAAFQDLLPIAKIRKS